MKKKAKNNIDLQKHVPPIKVKGIATYRKNKSGSYLILGFIDIHASRRQLLIPASDINDIKKVKKLLIDNGYPHTTSGDEWNEIRKLLCRLPEVKYELVENPGFHGKVYLQPNNTIIGNICPSDFKPILDPNRKAPLPLIETKGTLTQWKQNVAKSALYSSRIMLSLSATFSSYILFLAGIENGGFHIFGNSSMGKSANLFVSVSVRSGPEGVESWSLTDTGLEELAAAHNDKTLALDESGKLDSDPTKAAQRAGMIIYALTFGKDKCRSTIYSAGRLTWRLICLSTGEKSLVETAKDAGVQKMLGEEVRLVDVPADAGFGNGIYESLPKGVKAAEYAHSLEESYKMYYGVAEKAFLKQLTKQLANDAIEIKDQIKSAIAEFFEYNRINNCEGYEIRLAKRFALAYAGGKLAADYKILPFTDCEVLAGVSKCYQDTIAQRPHSFQQKVKAGTETLLTELKNKGNFLDVRSPNHGKTIEEIESTNGFTSLFKDETVRALKPAYVKTLIQNDKVRKVVLDNLKNSGRLKTDANGRSTIQLRSHLNSRKALPRCYCFTRNSEKSTNQG